MSAAGQPHQAARTPTSPSIDDPAWLACARRYRRQRLGWFLAHTTVRTAATAVAVWLRLPVSVQRRTERRITRAWAASACTVGLYAVVARLADLPARAWHDLVIERRYGLSTQPARAWLRDQVTGLVLALPLQVGSSALLIRAVHRWPRRWWIPVSIASGLLATLAAFLFPVVIAPRFNRFRPLDDAILVERFRSLAASAGIPVNDVLVADLSRRTRKANAFVLGLGRTRRVVLGDTLLGQFSPDEITTVLAHELAHQVYRDVWRMLVVSSAAVTVTSWATQTAAERVVRRFGRRIGLVHLAQPAALPLLGLIAALASGLLAPFLNTVSRRIERRADRFALALTGDAEAYARALTRLAVANLADPAPPALEHWLFDSHPPITERIALARAFAARRAAGTADAGAGASPPPPGRRAGS